MTVCNMYPRVIIVYNKFPAYAIVDLQQTIV